MLSTNIMKNFQKQPAIFLKKFISNWKAALLKKYENKIANKCMIVAVSEKDKETYQEKFGAKNIEYLPVFLPFH